MIFRHPTVLNFQVRSRNLRRFVRGELPKKIQAILERIISGVEKAVLTLEERSKVVEVLPTPPPEVVAEIFLKPDEEPEPGKAPSVPPPEVVAAVITPAPRTNGDIVGHSDESDDNESDHSDEGDDASDK